MPLCYGNSRAIWDHSVNCHPAEVTFLSLPQPVNTYTRFSDPGWNARLRWPSLLGDILIWYTHRKTVTYSSTNWAQCKVSCAKTDATITPSHQVCWCYCFGSCCAHSLGTHVVGPILWGHSGPLCYALSSSSSSLLTSMRRWWHLVNGNAACGGLQWWMSPTFLTKVDTVGWVQTVDVSYSQWWVGCGHVVENVSQFDYCTLS